MVDKPKPWFRLKLRDDVADAYHASLFSKEVIDVLPDQKWLRSEFVVYGASPMIIE